MKKIMFIVVFGALAGMLFIVMPPIVASIASAIIALVGRFIYELTQPGGEDFTGKVPKNR